MRNIEQHFPGETNSTKSAENLDLVSGPEDLTPRPIKSFLLSNPHLETRTIRVKKESLFRAQTLLGEEDKVPSIDTSKIHLDAGSLTSRELKSCDPKLVLTPFKKCVEHTHSVSVIPINALENKEVSFN